MEQLPRRRVSDKSTAEVRQVVTGAMAAFGGWRSDLARFDARAGRTPSEVDRRSMLERCDHIEAELLAVRTDLLLELAEAPPRLAGHSRVVDVEKALDGIAAQTAALRARLG